MKTWTPFKLSLLLTIVLLAAPLIMAFVFKMDGMAEAGWTMYFLLIPASLIAITIGLITSLILKFRRRHWLSS